MGLFDFVGKLFGGKKETVSPITVDPRNPQRAAVDSFLSNFLNTYGPQYKPGSQYGGKFTAPLGQFENQGLDQFLAEYLNKGVSSEMGDARGLLNKTINGGFDPNTSAYYQALREQAGYNRKQAVTQTNADLGSRNKFFSSEAVNKYGDINAQTGNTLNLAMADLADKERNRSMAAVPQALGLEEYLAKIPLQKATAATTIGAIPRGIEQADLEAQYQDFKRKQDELKGVVSTATSGTSTTQTATGYPDPKLQRDNGMSGFLSTFLGSGAGQGALGSIGKAIGGAVPFIASLFCWVAAEIFGGWNHPKTEACRFYIAEMAPEWFRNFYMKHGERFAAFIKDKPILKALIRPLFELFAALGKNEIEARQMARLNERTPLWQV